MLRDGAVDFECGWDQGGGYEEWQDVDRELRSIAKRQAGLDAELVAALREAERVRLWRHLGFSSMLEYLEVVFGYSPRVAQERLRTARRLEQLPELARALADHELSFSAVRELSRIATPKTERAWRTAARGRTLREIEEMVAGLSEGDLPTSPKNPDLRPRRLAYDGILPETCALERQARQALEIERGERLDDNAFVAALFRLALAGPQVGDGAGDRAAHQIVQYHCVTCGRGTQVGAGRQFDLSPAEVERARCDAEVVSLDPSARASQVIPKSVRRAVELRDGKRCRAPGCRASRNLELHHIVHREHGGTNDPWNLLLLCDAHHVAHHHGTLEISGRAPDAVVFRRIGEPVARPACEVVTSEVDDGEPAARQACEVVASEADLVARVAGARPSEREDRNGAARAPRTAANAQPLAASSPTCIARPAPTLTAQPRTSSSAEPRGEAPRSEPRAHVGTGTKPRTGQARTQKAPSRYDHAKLRTLAASTIKSTGWTLPIAYRAIDSVFAEHGTDLSLEELLRLAFPRCRP